MSKLYQHGKVPIMKEGSIKFTLRPLDRECERLIPELQVPLLEGGNGREKEWLEE